MGGRLENYFTADYQADLDWMSSHIIETGDMVHWAGRKGDFEEHLETLETTFSGTPFICFYHSGLIVLIRRKIDLEINIAKFNRLWSEKSDVLLKHLSSRWLVSACDTIQDVASDPYEKALALAGTVLINVAKLYESERYATAAGTKHLKERRGTVHLFDGVMRFSAGNGDMITNMIARANAVAGNSPVAGRILLELFGRMQSHNTVFRRFETIRKRMNQRMRLKKRRLRREKNRQGDTT